MPTELPDGFARLEPFVGQFAIAGTAARAALRGDARREDREAFHAAARDLIGPALDLLDAKPLSQHTAAEQRLMNMTLAFAHIALAVEIHGPDEDRHTPMRAQMRITRSPADSQVQG